MPDIAVTLVKSPIGNRPQARATVLALGLRRLHQTVIIPDNTSVRGMVTSIAHLVQVGPAPPADKSRKKHAVETVTSRSRTAVAGHAESPSERVTSMKRGARGDELAGVPAEEPVAPRRTTAAKTKARPVEEQEADVHAESVSAGGDAKVSGTPADAVAADSEETLADSVDQSTTDEAVAATSNTGDPE